MPMPDFTAGRRLRASELNTLADQVDLLTAPGWTLLSLTGSWVNRAGYAAAAFRKILGGAALELVLNISGGTMTNGTTIFTLPAGSRPITKVQLTTATRIASAPQQLGALEIDTTGAAKIYDIGSSATLHVSGLIPLDI